MDEVTPAGRPIVDREKTAPFLIRTFIKIGGFHRTTQFEDGQLPLADEQQIYTWKDATLREVLTTLRTTAPNSPEYRHPLARYTFKAIYADAASRGRYLEKSLGTVYSRDILGEPGTLSSIAPRLLKDEETFGGAGGVGVGSGGEEKSGSGTLEENADGIAGGDRGGGGGGGSGGGSGGGAGREERTLDELRFVPGDYMIVMVVLPKSATVPSTNELSIKGSSSALNPSTSLPPSSANGWKSTGGGAGGAGPGGRVGDSGWGGTVNPSLGSSGAGRGSGGGHWRGDSSGIGGGGRGGRGGGRGGDRDRERDRERDRDRERRIPPPRRDSPPPPRRGGWGDRRDRRSLSRSRSPPRKRNTRYD